jgi:outer membrane protein assembly factor BamB
LALDKKTGSKVWASDAGVCGYATPVFTGPATKREALFFGAKALYAVDASTGKELWSFPWATHMDINVADPLVTRAGIFITSGYNKGSAMLAVRDSVVTPAWTNLSLKSQFSSPILLGDYIYGIDGQTGSGGLGIVCLDVKTGAKKWNRQIGFGAMSAAGDKLIVLTEKGDLIVAAASPAGYQEIARAAKVVSNPKCWTMPVLCKGFIYCRNLSGELAAVDVR